MSRIRGLALLAALVLAPIVPAAAQSSFVRGDCNVDQNIDISDPVFLLGVLFSGGTPSSCADACDGNDDGSLDIADAVFGLAFLFSGGSAPAAPYPNCGTDPTADATPCASYPGCATTETICNDLVDNDGDGATDCDDPDCLGAFFCLPETICDDGADNDGDGFTDCDDLDCVGTAACTPESICDDGVDNDGDGFTDCDDFDCTGAPACTPESICDDGLDNDGDGFTDCSDFDCMGTPACPVLSHAIDIQPIWDMNCTFCHGGPTPFQDLDLDPLVAYSEIVGTASTECSVLDRIDPFSPSTSWLYRKVQGTHTAQDIIDLGCNVGTGSQMPIGPSCCLTPAEEALIEQWILQGAAP